MVKTEIFGGHLGFLAAILKKKFAHDTFLNLHSIRYVYAKGHVGRTVCRIDPIPKLAKTSGVLCTSVTFS